MIQDNSTLTGLHGGPGPHLGSMFPIISELDFTALWQITGHLPGPGHVDCKRVEPLEWEVCGGREAICRRRTEYITPRPTNSENKRTISEVYWLHIVHDLKLLQGPWCPCSLIFQLPGSCIMSQQHKVATNTAAVKNLAARVLSDHGSWLVTQEEWKAHKDLSLAAVQ